MPDQSTNSSSLIQGDRFSGICLDAHEASEINAEAGSEVIHESFTLDGHDIVMDKQWSSLQAGLKKLEIRFTLSEPVRFRVDVLIPAICLNACATMNGRLLLGWFGDRIPDGVPEIPESPCQEHGKPYSPLRPGQFQSVNFRWQNQDCLCYYFVMPQFN
ncbi:MAG: hypothetical protein VB070_00615 [Clostridiaceae bacterium]|nr:hypothetical protein [Clostridiaceae bacterium]